MSERPTIQLGIAVAKGYYILALEDFVDPPHAIGTNCELEYALRTYLAHSYHVVNIPAPTTKQNPFRELWATDDTRQGSPTYLQQHY